jgi:hypothetical protein
MSGMIIFISLYAFAALVIVMDDSQWDRKK